MPTTTGLLSRNVYAVITVVLFVCLCVNGGLFLFYSSDHDRRVGLFFFIVLTPLFVLFTVLSVRRGRPAATAEEVPCPNCGYNLRGLKEARCPECGCEYTIEQLVTADRHGG